MAQSNLPKGVDEEVVERAIKLGRIDVNSLADKNLKAFVEFLKANGLEDVIVIGGTARDIFFNKATDDLDITVKIRLFYGVIEEITMICQTTRKFFSSK